jgi:hypothetical protein
MPRRFRPVLVRRFDEPTIATRPFDGGSYRNRTIDLASNRRGAIGLASSLDRERELDPRGDRHDESTVEGRRQGRVDPPGQRRQDDAERTERDRDSAGVPVTIATFETTKTQAPTATNRRPPGDAWTDRDGGARRSGERTTGIVSDPSTGT